MLPYLTSSLHLVSDSRVSLTLSADEEPAFLSTLLTFIMRWRVTHLTPDKSQKSLIPVYMCMCVEGPVCMCSCSLDYVLCDCVCHYGSLRCSLPAAIGLLSACVCVRICKIFCMHLCCIHSQAFLCLMCVFAVCRFPSSRTWCSVWKEPTGSLTMACGREAANTTMAALSCIPGQSTAQQRTQNMLRKMWIYLLLLIEVTLYNKEHKCE